MLTQQITVLLRLVTYFEEGLYHIVVRGESALLTELPTTVILGNPVSDKRASRKLSVSVLSSPLPFCFSDHSFRSTALYRPCCRKTLVSSKKHRGNFGGHNK